MLNNEKLKKKYENESKTFTYQSKFLKSSSLALIRGMGIERYCLPTLIEYCIVILNQNNPPPPLESPKKCN